LAVNASRLADTKEIVTQPVQNKSGVKKIKRIHEKSN